MLGNYALELFTVFRLSGGVLKKGIAHTSYSFLKFYYF